MTISLAQLAISWNQMRVTWALGEGESIYSGDYVAFTDGDLLSCLSGNHEWRRVCPTEVDQSGLFVFFCLQTSFVIFKIAVNIPLNGTASAHHIEFSLLKETTQGLRVLWMWHVTDTDITVTVTSQTSGTSAIYLSCSPNCHENWAKCNILRVRIIKKSSAALKLSFWIMHLGRDIV